MSRVSNGPGDGSEGFDKQIQQFAEHAGAQMEQVRVALDDLDERVRAFVRDRPGAAVVGAFAIGWFVGKIASKWSR